MPRLTRSQSLLAPPRTESELLRPEPQLTAKGPLQARTVMPPRLGWQRDQQKWVSGRGRPIGTHFSEGDLGLQTFLPGITAPPSSAPIERFKRPLAPHVSHGPRERSSSAPPRPEREPRTPPTFRRTPPRERARSRGREEDDARDELVEEDEPEVRAEPRRRRVKDDAPPKRRREEPDTDDTAEEKDEEEELPPLTSTQRRKLERIWEEWHEEHPDELPLNEPEVRDARIRLLRDESKLTSSQRRELETLERRSGGRPKGGLDGLGPGMSREKVEARIAEIRAMPELDGDHERLLHTLLKQQKAWDDDHHARLEDQAEDLATQALVILRERPPEKRKYQKGRRKTTDKPVPQKPPSRLVLAERYVRLLRIAEITHDGPRTPKERRELQGLQREERIALRDEGPIPSIEELGHRIGPPPEEDEPDETKDEAKDEAKEEPPSGEDTGEQDEPEGRGREEPETTPFTWVPGRPTPLLAPPTSLDVSPRGEAPTWVSSRPTGPRPEAGATPRIGVAREQLVPGLDEPGARRAIVRPSLRKGPSLRARVHDALSAPILRRIAKRGLGRAPIGSPPTIGLDAPERDAPRAEPPSPSRAGGTHAPTERGPAPLGLRAPRRSSWPHRLHEALAAPILRRVQARRDRRVAREGLGGAPMVGLGAGTSTPGWTRTSPSPGTAPGAPRIGLRGSPPPARTWAPGTTPGGERPPGPSAGGHRLRGGTLLRPPLREPETVGLGTESTTTTTTPPAPTPSLWGERRFRPSGQVTTQQLLVDTTERTTARERARTEGGTRSSGRSRTRSAPPGRTDGGTVGGTEGTTSTTSTTSRHWRAPPGRGRRRAGAVSVPRGTTPPGTVPHGGAPREDGDEPDVRGLSDLAQAELLELLERMVEGRGQGAEVMRRVLQLLEDRARLQRTREIG